MRVLIPVDEVKGLDSPITDEFGAAPFFLVATDGGELEVYRNEEVIQGRGHRWEEILQLSQTSSSRGRSGDPHTMPLGPGALKYSLPRAPRRVKRWRSEDATNFGARTRA
jgi:hypothetical protein